MLKDSKSALFLAFVLAITPAAFGASALKAVLGDVAAWDESEKIKPDGSIEKSIMNYSYEYENTISSRDINLNSADSQLDFFLPLTQKSALEISSSKKASLIQMSNGDGGFGLSDRSDVINLLYSARLSDYLNIGLGVNQRSGAETGADRKLGHNYKIRINYAGLLLVEYSAERSAAGAVGRLNSAGNWVEYPAFWHVDNSKANLSARLGQRINLNLKYQRAGSEPYRTAGQNYGVINDGGENTEIITAYDLNDNLKLTGKLGTRTNNQNYQVYRDGTSFAHFQSDLASQFGVLGVAGRLKGSDFSFNIFRSRIDLSGWGSSLSEYLPNIISSVSNVDKALDLESRLTLNGCSLGLNRVLSDRLTLKGDVSYITMLLSGNANLWNSFFFGLAKQLDQNYNLSFNRVDFLQAGLGLKYAVNDGLALNYSLRQLIPVYAENSAPAGAGDGIGSLADVSASSGGNLQTMSVTYYF